MNTKFRILLCALALAVPGRVILKASDIVPARTSGHVVVFDNDRTLEGDIERRGDQYCVRRSIGETWLPAEHVVALCADLEEAWKFLRTRANLRDPDERLRLARWCLFHGLRHQALEEVTAALDLRPNHTESQRLFRSLQQSNTPSPAPPKPREESESSATPSLPLDFNPDALGVFTKRVQPILMNTCACCHATGHGGSFKLTQAFESGLLNHRATQQNLVAVLAEINRERPQASLLLTKALSAHGEAELPPIKSRQAPTYRTLEEWVKNALVNEPYPSAAQPVAALPVTESKTFVEMLGSKPEAAPPVAAPRPTTMSKLPEPVPSPPTERLPPTSPAPAAPASASAVDPFDPANFNRQMHPDKR